MRLSLFVSGPALKTALVAMAFGGVVVASCTFNPGPAGSDPLRVGHRLGLRGQRHPRRRQQRRPDERRRQLDRRGRQSGTAPTPDGANCGLQQYGLENVPPDLLIIEDKSGSMGEQQDGTKCPGMGAACETKWADTTGALNMVVAQTQATIRWGLKYFATNNSCGVTAGATIAVGPNNSMPIANSIARTMPDGSTPTRLAVNSGVAYLQTLTDPNPKFILLATDGLPNCAPGQAMDADDSTGAVAAVTAAAAAGFPVFVVGVGNVAAAQATLNMMAVAGGRPQAGATKYYPVSSTADLVTVLGTIGGQITSCSFALGQAPPDPNNIGVYGDGKPTEKIAKDPSHTNGWDYGAGMKSIVLYGGACDNIKNKVYKTVQAIFGCPGMVIPSRDPTVRGYPAHRTSHRAISGSRARRSSSSAAAS